MALAVKKHIINNFIDILQKQEKLNDKIIVKYGLFQEFSKIKDKSKNYILAYLAELGEVLQEINIKFWKKSEVNMRYKPKKDGNIKEEAIDLLHFAISIYIDLIKYYYFNAQIENELKNILKKVNKAFVLKDFWAKRYIYNEMFIAVYTITDLYIKIQKDEKISKKKINDFFYHTLYFVCNFFDNFEDLINNYNRKYEINLSRIENNY